MNTRNPLRPANLRDLLSEVLRHLGEFSDEQLEALSMATNQHLFARDCQNGEYDDVPYIDSLEDLREEEDSYTDSGKYDSRHDEDTEC